MNITMVYSSMDMKVNFISSVLHSLHTTITKFILYFQPTQINCSSQILPSAHLEFSRPHATTVKFFVFHMFRSPVVTVVFCDSHKKFKLTYTLFTGQFWCTIYRYFFLKPCVLNGVWKHFQNLLHGYRTSAATRKNGDLPWTNVKSANPSVPDVVFEGWSDPF